MDTALTTSNNAVPEEIKQAFTEADQYFDTPLQKFQFFDKYSRFDYTLGRRETWVETVDRTVSFLKELSDNKLPDKDYQKIRQFILDMKAAPSMRLLAMAGDAARRNNICLYNCSFSPIDSIDAWVEGLIISMCGCGVGFSVERKHVEQLPEVKLPTDNLIPYIVEDTTEGWAESLRFGLTAFFNGDKVAFDYSQIRPAGAPLKIKGGQACLTGDTVVYRDKKKWGKDQNQQKIADLYDLWQRGIGRSKEVTIRCLDEKTGQFYRNRVVDVVDNGLANIYQVTLENGYSIKATNNHRFMTLNGSYKPLIDFKIGEVMAVNGIEAKTARCVDCKTAISRRAIRCRPCCDKNQIKEDANETTARRRKDCLNARKNYCEICNMITPRLFEVHHIDRNPHNNDDNNLVNLCDACHRSIHTQEDNFGIPHRQKFIAYAKIKEIKPMGTDRVFDIQMQSPDHNFIANGFVSHNSGPDPLQKLHKFAEKVIRSAYKHPNHKLTSLDAHDIMCEVGSTAVSGGVRRTAMISLFDFDDEEMRNCKNGDNLIGNEQRWNANNSAVWPVDIDETQIIHQMVDMVEGERGEPGIFNRDAANRLRPARRQIADYGTNPCAEINLLGHEFCNLSIAIARPNDDFVSLAQKVSVATMIGTIQSTATHFPGLRSTWVKNCQEERLLGVDITGQLDCPAVQDPDVMSRLKQVAVDTNRRYAKLLGINESAAITCVKPSGNSSQLFNCSSGLHARWAPYYIRNVRVSTFSPLFKVLRDAGVPMDPENGQEAKSAITWVIHFPIKSPDNAITRQSRNAITQCEYWLMNKKHWTEHNPSVTITYKPEEVMDLIKWVVDHKEYIGGMSFLPTLDAQYSQMPYEEISEEEYKDLSSKFPAIDFSRLYLYEHRDLTTSAQEVACVSGACELDLSEMALVK